MDWVDKPSWVDGQTKFIVDNSLPSDRFMIYNGRHMGKTAALTAAYNNRNAAVAAIERARANNRPTLMVTDDIDDN